MFFYESHLIKYKILLIFSFFKISLLYCELFNYHEEFIWRHLSAIWAVTQL